MENILSPNATHNTPKEGMNRFNFNPDSWFEVRKAIELFFGEEIFGKKDKTPIITISTPFSEEYSRISIALTELLHQECYERGMSTQEIGEFMAPFSLIHSAYQGFFGKQVL